MRWRWPPENSCGKRRACSGARPTRSSSSSTLPSASSRAHAVQAQRRRHQLAHRLARVQRRERVLEDHLHVAAQRLERLAARGGDVLAVEADLAGAGLEQPHQRPRQRGLAAARLPHQPHRLALVEGEADVVDGLDAGHLAAEHDALAHREVLAQVVDLEQRLGAVALAHATPSGAARGRSGRPTTRSSRLASASSQHRSRWPARLAGALLQVGRLLALVELVRAAGREVAARRPVGQRRRQPRDGRQPLGAVAIDAGDRAQQAPRVRVLGVVEDLVQRALLHDPARVHHGHAVGDVGHHAQVVGHQDHGRARLVAQRPDPVQDLGLDGHVQCRGGLVGDQQLGVARQRQRDHHPLAHAARELVRVRVGAVARRAGCRPAPAAR